MTFTNASVGESTDAPVSLDDDRQVKEEAQEHNAVFWIEKGLADCFYYYDEAVGQLKGFSQQEIDLQLLQQAKELAPRTQGKTSAQMQRFNEVMDHFLAGSGRTVYFKMAELLNTCGGARRRVSEAITFRLSRHLDVIFGHPSCDLSTNIDTSRGKPVKYSIYQFPIHQNDYQDTDWQFALGTFGAMWEPLRPKTNARAAGPLCRLNVGDDWIDEGTLAQTRNKPPKDCFNMPEPRPTHAKVWGTKIWRWHSETDRPSEQVHQAAYRLVQSRRLRNFWVVALPCIVEISTGMPAREAR
jgi:hypothetical protein